MNATKLIFEKGSPGRRAMELPDCDVPRKENLIPEEFLRQRLDLPEAFVPPGVAAPRIRKFSPER